MTKIPVNKLPSPSTYAETRQQNETLRQALCWAEDWIRKLEGEVIAATNKAMHPPGWKSAEGIWHYCADGHDAVCGEYLAFYAAVEELLNIDCGGVDCIECLVLVDQSKIRWDRS